jgi:N-formylglutamate amidohydrolase
LIVHHTTDNAPEEQLMTSAAPSFELLPGAEESPVILHVPHSAREIPADVRAGIVLDDDALERELDHIVDAHTALIAGAASELSAVTPWRFVNRLSRLVVDPERFPDEREEMLAVGMGAVYTRTTHRERLRPTGTDPEPLLARYFRPYADAMTEAVAERLAAAGRAVIVDVHSYPTRALPYELHGHGPRPPVCLGTDTFHTPPELLAAARRPSRGAGRSGWTARSAGRTCRWSSTVASPA